MNAIYHNPSKQELRMLEEEIESNFYLIKFLKKRMEKSLEADKDISDSMNALINRLKKENDSMIISRSTNDEPKRFYWYDAGYSFHWKETEPVEISTATFNLKNSY